MGGFLLHKIASGYAAGTPGDTGACYSTLARSAPRPFADEAARPKGEMDVSENAVHSFIIRLWCEEKECDAPLGVWRGHLTHVPSRQRRHIQNLDEIVTIIMEYLRDPDGPPTPG